MKKLTVLALALAAVGALSSGSPALAQGAIEAVEVAAPDSGTEADQEIGARTLADWYEMGGWVMHGLVLCSILAVALILERIVALRRNAVIPRKFMSTVMDHWHKREVNQVVALCGASEVSIARVLRAGLIHFDEGLARMEDAIATAGDHEATLLRRNLPVLAAIGNIATMMGLLGTVLGMIESFDLIAKTGTGDARVVAGGIFQALVTTAAGLIVGITSIAAHSYLRRKVEVLEIDLEETSFRLLEELAIDRTAETGTVTAPSEDRGLAPAGA